MSGSYNYNVKLSLNRNQADWFENIVGYDDVDKYIMKLVEADIEKWKKIEVEVLQPIVNSEEELRILSEKKTGVDKYFFND
jgi:hypothetical protein